MEQPELENIVRNIDARVGRIEQILPTLVTRDDLKTALAPLPTRAEMREAIQTAIEPLPTKVEMHEAIQRAVAPLATKVEMDHAIQRAVAPLATRVEMDHGIQRAVEPLATKVEMREEGERTRRHFDVIAESLRDDIRLLAEGQVSLVQRVDELRTELKGDIARLDGRVMRLEVARPGPA